MAVRGKALVISLDCVNAALLDQWSVNNRLPHLTALRERGAFGRLTCNSVSIESDWHSFYTGRQPSEHGHCSYDEIILGTYRSRMTTAPRSVHRPFWETLSRDGAQVIAFNPPHAEAAPVADGIVVTDWLVHDAGHYKQPASYPPEFIEKLLLRYPGDPVNPNDWGHSITADPKRLFAAKCETLGRKMEFLVELLQSHVWDVCYVSFDECHEISHLFWHVHDPSHPRHAASPTAADPVAAMLTKLDEAVGRLVALTDENCAIIVISIGGIAANYHWSHLLDTILRRIDNPVDQSGASYKALRAMWNRIPHTVQRSFFGLRHRLRETMLERDRRKRRVFALPLNERAGAVRINLAGREPGGLVAPGNEYDAVCQDLIDVFNTLVCAKTGAPLVRSVVKTRDVLAGPFVDRLPDLMIEWNVERPITVATSPRTGEIRRELSDARTGHHINDGFLVVSGAGTERGEAKAVVDLAEIAKATIAYVRSGQKPFAGLFA